MLLPSIYTIEVQALISQNDESFVIRKLAPKFKAELDPLSNRN